MSDKEFDPLSKLFTTGEMAGLASKKSKEESSEITPIEIPEDLDLVVQEEDHNEESVVEDAPEQLEMTQEDKLAMAMKLAQQAMEKKKLEEQEKADHEAKVAKAMALAQQAIQRNQSGQKTEQKQQESLAERLAKVQSKEKRSAMDLFMEQAEAKEPQKTKKAPPKKVSKPPVSGNTIIQKVEKLIKRRLPSLNEFHVVNATSSIDRTMHKALWMVHLGRFLANGQFEYAVGASSVIEALNNVDIENLVVASVETTASEYLLWIDLTEQTLIAAFPDSSKYLQF